MKKLYPIIFIIIVLFITSCADQDAKPAAVVFTRMPDDVIESSDTTTVNDPVVEDITEAETTTIPETTITEEESIPAPLTELILITEPSLYSSTGNINIVLNINSGIYHLDSECSYVKQALDENKRTFGVDDITVMEDYDPCSRCGGTIETEAIQETTLPEDTTPPDNTITAADAITVTVNLNTKTFHADQGCRHIKAMNEENKGEYTGTVDEIKTAGYKACGTCSKQYKD